MENPTWIVLAGILGLCIGSFLNVVIYRLPVMMERQAARDVAEYLGKEDPHPEPFSLLRPRSKCGSCNKFLTWKSNIPVVGWLMRWGHCEHCNAKFSSRYMWIELLTGGLFAYVAWQNPGLYGLSLYGLALMGFISLLIALTFIDMDTQLLPDDMTLPAMWLGILVSISGFGQISVTESVVGAMVGYLSLWSVFWAFLLLTGKEGMGYGDFKWLAAIGAWVGISGLLPVILVASITGVVFGVYDRMRSQDDAHAFAFGPFLSAGALVQLFYPLNIMVISEAMGQFLP